MADALRDLQLSRPDRQLWALVAPALMGTSPLFVLLFYWTFRRIPSQLFEAARLDGAGSLVIWAQDRHAARLADHRRGGGAGASCSTGATSSARCSTSSPRADYTLPVGLQILQQMDKHNWPLADGGAVIMTAPVVVLFLIVQRYFWPERGGRSSPGH